MNLVAPELQELAGKLVDGDGLGWPGDPRLELRMGVISDRLGREVARRLEVWRYNEDGTEARVGSWHPSEQFRVVFDLSRMRLDRPNRVDVTDTIDAHNAEIEAKADRVRQDALGEYVERRAHDFVFKKMGNAKNTHQISNNPLAAPDAG